MRLAQRWLIELVDDAFRVPMPHVHGTHPTRALTRFVHRSGIALGAPILRDDEKLVPGTGGLSPLIRFLAVLVDGARIAAHQAGLDDADARRALFVALALLVDDDGLARELLARDTKQKRVDAAAITLGARLRRRRLLFGNPIVGLTLIYGLTAVDGALVLELTTLLLRGLSIDDVVPLVERARDARRLLIAEIAALTREREGLEMAVDVAEWQVKNLGLARRERAAAAAALDDGFDRDALQRRLDIATRRRVFHAAMLAAHLDGIETAVERAFLTSMAASYGISPRETNRVRRRVVTFIGAHRDVLNPLEKEVGFEIDGAPMTVKVARALRTGSKSVVTEIKETGDLAVLLAKRAAGQELTDDESARMWEQLKDVARVVPSLAVFTLPGGAFLLPLLFRVLPFDLRPSAFRPSRFRAFGDDVGTISSGRGSGDARRVVAETRDDDDNERGAHGEDGDERGG